MPCIVSIDGLSCFQAKLFPKEKSLFDLSCNILMKLIGVSQARIMLRMSVSEFLNIFSCNLL